MADQLRPLFVLVNDYPWTSFFAVCLLTSVLSGFLKALVLIFRPRQGER